ncbi:Arylsulfatase G [Holothuria leucospilota]|uniref:Arylsulfatase G n=1 Tax=Holothuria leucospilota TaxID=206669 RepID=A0A9Q1C464_HOLLE|nr:Arylsulfatase G [Holothuria leucospilota]
MAAQFIQNGLYSSNPYLLYVALAHMHVPLFHMPEFEGKSASNTVYGDTLMEMDNTIKTIVEAIKESGEEENTLVWVVSDNGPNEYECQYGGSLGPFTGTWQREQGGGASKGSVFEAGHRVPSIVYWPGTIKGGQVSDALTSTMDIYPTMAALANIQMPDKRIYDGVDISDLLMGTPALSRRVLFHPIAHIVDGPRQCVIDAVRKDDYKAIFAAGGYRACGENPGITQSYSPPLIFNVKEDPMESSPLDPDSDLFRSVLEQVDQAMVDIHRTLKLDKTPVQEGEYDPCALPCCNPLNVVCRCN